MHSKKILKYKSEYVKIDVDIANTLQLMWKAGINTTNSCQAQCALDCKHKNKKIKQSDGSIFFKKILTKKCNQYVWICFESSSDLELFYNSVGIWDKNFPPINSTWAILPVMTNLAEFIKWGRFKPHNTVMTWKSIGCAKNNFKMQPQLTFPRSDLPLIEKLLRLYLDNKSFEKKIKLND